MKEKTVNTKVEKKIEVDISLFSTLSETEKAFVMGAIWSMVSNKNVVTPNVN